MTDHLFTNKRASDAKLGDYVFASRWPNCDWNDPWAVGFVCEIGKNYVRVDDGDGGWIEGVGQRCWRYCQHVSGTVGAAIVTRYPGLEGSNFDPQVAVEIFTQSD